MTAGVAADPATMPDDTPPTVWTWNKPSGDRFANINRMVNCIHGEPSSQLHERHDA
ncbi:MAG: hypothetical protein HY060_01000, partial [Proteobacteria bacterium]|nr:hypothetical protein [Pseudomonadota bacterium]